MVRSQIFGSANFRKNVFRGSQIFGDPVFVQDGFRVKAIKAKRLREGNVGNFALPIQGDEKSFPGGGIQIVNAVAEALLQVAGNLKSHAHVITLKRVYQRNC
jgi:hypothetical protein